MIITTGGVTAISHEHLDATVEVLDDGVDVRRGEVLVQFRADMLDKSVRRFVAVTCIDGRRIDRRVGGAGAVRGVLWTWPASMRGCRR